MNELEPGGIHVIRDDDDAELGPPQALEDQQSDRESSRTLMEQDKTEGATRPGLTGADKEQHGNGENARKEQNQGGRNAMDDGGKDCGRHAGGRRTQD